MDAEAAQYCADLVRRLDHDRYLCALVTPSSARAHVLALFAFNVEVARIRESIREPIMGQMRLQWWREIVEGAPSGMVRQHPVALALADAIRTRTLTLAHFDRLLTARERDIGDEAPTDLAALEAYAEATSSSLALLVLEILGVRDASAEAAGRHVGIAWALTGLLRAVPFHAAQRRSYLPADRMAAAGLEAHRLFEGRPGEGLAAVAREVADRAARHLAAARDLRPAVPRAAVPALLPAVLADLQLKRLARIGYSLFDPRVGRASGRRALHLAWAAWRGRY